MQLPLSHPFRAVPQGNKSRSLNYCLSKCRCISCVLYYLWIQGLSIKHFFSIETYHPWLFSTEVLLQLQCFVTVIKCPVKSNSREHRLIMSYSSRGLGSVMTGNTCLQERNVCDWGKKPIDGIAARRKRMNRKWGWETKHHGLPPVAHFLQWGSTSKRFRSSQTVLPARNQVWKHRTLWRTSHVQTSTLHIWLLQVLDQKLFKQNSLNL